MHLSPAIAFLFTVTPSCILALPTQTSSNTLVQGSQVQKRSTDELIYELSSLPRVWQQASQCDLSSVSMPLSQASSPSTLPSPSEGLVLSHVAVGRGTQNYTCSGLSPSATPKAVGALATLFNATCASVDSPDLLYTMPSVALQYDVPNAQSALQAYDILLSGHHYFTNTTTPFFNLDTSDHEYGLMAGKKTDSANAPADAIVGQNGKGYGAVAWLKISSLDEDGFAFKEVYRLNTAGGQPPSSCQNETGDFTVEYAATYWLWAAPGVDAEGKTADQEQDNSS
ncbi:hypothetical protein K490DRAFT_75564 [Saccharata proteae CBS 121410]|uniref:Malate dehydrogenase n=1 Tax=Saccharata proteae CBS 121410 TaxID=1314787 RepID=A0A9P4HSN5_9PEZI|nr:hypothetical protein K490DRAFT_75564 [Saccharata proteae CBS 121410]